MLTVFWPASGLPVGFSSTDFIPEDDGESTNGSIRLIKAVISVGVSNASLSLSSVGTFPGAPAVRAYSLRLRGLIPSGPPRVTVNGTAWADWNSGNTTGGALGESDMWAHAAGAGVDGWTIPVLTINIPPGDSSSPFDAVVSWD